MKHYPHFWLIFFRGDNRWGWRAYAAARGGLDVIAYPTKKSAVPDLQQARETYGKANVRLYKFRPDGFIFGGHK